MNGSLAKLITESEYGGYAYAYPHKTAYRPLEPDVPLEHAWRNEDKKNLFLYVHLPFCEKRCGFCNLFTTASPGTAFVNQTLKAIEKQSNAVAEVIAPDRIAQAAFGGGTPSLLSDLQIHQLFRRLGRTWPVQWDDIPVSFEMSPSTVTPDKLALLKDLGVSRISLGAQSFVSEDMNTLRRIQDVGKVEQSCRLIRSFGFEIFSVDLMYGCEGQDARRWQYSLERTLEWKPEELYLYPLYIGKLTALNRNGKRPGELRQTLYRQARDFLQTAGYRQISMRHFRRMDVIHHTDYCCQDDGMIGLGPGARSYTRSLHYSSEYAVGQPSIKTIIGKFNTWDAKYFTAAHYGVVLPTEEQKRRYIIKSLLRVEGVSSCAYLHRFGSLPSADFPALSELFALGLASENDDGFVLTSDGLEWSDTIGPWLYSPAMNARMNSCQLS